MINNKFNRRGKILFLLLFSAILSSCSMIKSVNEQEQQIPEKIQTAEAQLARGVNSYSQYDYRQARHFFHSALHTYRSIDNLQGIILSVTNLAKTALALGDIRRAEDYVAKAKILINTSSQSQSHNIIEHLAIVESSIKIEQHEYIAAKIILQPLLDKKTLVDSAITTAALQNRVRIAIAEQDQDAIEWLQHYAQMVSRSQQSSQQARLMRFNAALSKNSEAQNSFYNKAMQLYRSHANQVGIAATLEEWSQQQFHLKQYHVAVDQLERALFIRIDLKDRINSIAILIKLHKIYQVLNNKDKQRKTSIWLKELSSRAFSRWSDLAEDYNSYP